jgi:SAM-dependent methyltransferase
MVVPEVILALIGDPHGDAAFVRHLRGVFQNPARQERYVSDGMERIQVVLRILEDLRQKRVRRVLELGANPYVMTLLIRRRFGHDFELLLANYFGQDAIQTASVHSVEVDGERIDLPFQHFNIERDPFPYSNGSFDCVLFCEILEHLLVNPGVAVGEIARILRPGGFVVVSTPNATRLPNLFFLAQGRSIWEWYSDNGPYGRHNREFTLAEVQDLLKRHGFEIDRSEVRNIQHLARRYTWLQWLRPSVWNEHLFVVGRK